MAIADVVPHRIRKDVALIPPRLALGSTMVFHGLSKLRGEGPKQTAGFFEQLDLKPAKPLAVATGAAELFAGVSALLGFGTRIAALAVLTTQAVAIRKVHAAKGFDITQGGYEFSLALMAIAAGLLVAGPGRFSAHEATEHQLKGRGPRRVLRRARPSLLYRLVKLIK